MIVRKNYQPAEAAAMTINTLKLPVKDAFLDFNKELGLFIVFEQVKRDWAPDAKLQCYYVSKINAVYPLKEEANSKVIKKTLCELKLLIIRYLQSIGDIVGLSLAGMVYDRLPRYVTMCLPGEREHYMDWAPLMDAAKALALKKDQRDLLPTRK